MANAQKAPRKHHYVPRLLLRNFTDATGTLWIYDTQARTVRDGNTRSAAFEKDLYALPAEEGGVDYDSLEMFLAAQIDAPGAVAIADLLRGEWPTEERWVQFVGFIAAQISRTPAFFERLVQTLASSMQEMLERMAKFNPAFREHVRAGLAEIGVSPEEIDEELRRIATGSYVDTPDPKRALLAAVKLIPPAHEALSEMNWAVMNVPEGDPNLVLGDHPVTLSDQGSNDEPPGPLGLRNPDLEVALPISKRMVVIGSRNQNWGMGDLLPGSADVMNARTMSHVHRFLFASENSEGILEQATTARGTGPKVHVTRIRVGKNLTIVKEYR